MIMSETLFPDYNTPHPSLRDDLSHKGRGYSYRFFTSPLVGEVAAQQRVRGIDYHSALIVEWLRNKI